MKPQIILFSTVTIMAFLLSCSSTRPSNDSQNEKVFAKPIDTTTQSNKALSLDDGLTDLSRQISSLMSEGQKQRIAVVEFSDLDGRTIEFGKFLSEELITRLFASKKFQVIERQLLDKILAEHKLNVSGLIDDTTAKRLGKILGVDAICSGTVTDFINYVRINARLISTETGTMFAGAAASIQMDDAIRIHMNKANTNGNPIDKPPTVMQKDTPPNVFYNEDFSEVQEGMLPKGWVGGEKLCVKNDGQKKYLADFEGSYNHKIFIDNIIFPQDFEFLLILEFSTDNKLKETELTLGEMKVRFNSWGDVYLGNSKGNIGDNSPSGKTMAIAVQKSGSVFKFLYDGVEKLMVRYPEFKNPKGVSLEFKAMINFKLFKIMGKTL